MMKSRSMAVIGCALALAFTFGACSVWLYQQAALYDATNKPATVKSRVMERKSHALEGLTSVVARGDLRRVAPLLEGLEDSVRVIEAYLDTEMYARYGGQYQSAVASLRSAVEGRNWLAAKEATLAVERSCMDCHQLLLGY